VHYANLPNASILSIGQVCKILAGGYRKVRLALINLRQWLRAGLPGTHCVPGRAGPPPRYHSPSLASVNGRCMALTLTLTLTLTLALKIALQFFIY